MIFFDYMKDYEPIIRLYQAHWVFVSYSLTAS